MGSAESGSAVNMSIRPMDLGMAALRQEASCGNSGGSAPTSPKTSGAVGGAHAIHSAVQTHPLNLAGGLPRPSHYNVELLRTASSGAGKIINHSS